MKKFILYSLTAIILTAVGCSESYDDSALVGRVDDLENRVTQLEELCRQMNTNISSLQTIVEALENNDYVTSVAPITQDGKTIGYTITFTKSQPITIYHGTDGKDGKDGENGKDGKDGIDGIDGKDGNDGHTPIIGIKQDTDGIYYWTLDGDWLLDDNGNKIKAQGIDGKDGEDGTDGKNGRNGTTPKLKIEDGYWYISYDYGYTWTLVGKATGEDGDTMFNDVTKDENYVYFTLSNDTTIKVPLISDGAIISIKFDAKHNPYSILQDIECEINDNGIISGRIPNIVDSKKLIPTIEYNGSKIFVGEEEITSEESIIDCSKPVVITVIGNNGAKKDYILEVTAFTGLPVMYINTEGNVDITSKDNYLNATIKIVEDIKTRGAGDVWTSDVKIKGRGNSTWSLPKKPYKLKFNEKVSLLGEPKDKEWVLLANYTDKTSIRNELGFFMGRMSNLSYTSRTHYVDLILNDKYVGTYQLAEQQKIAENRVNVGDDGYLLEIDARAYEDGIYFKVPSLTQPINIKDPDIEIGSEEYNYIVNFISEVEAALYSKDFTNTENGYAKYLDIDSFVDWYIINEIAKNNDAVFYTSCYMHHKKGGKLYMGPLWDFDIGFGNINYNNNNSVEGFWIKKAEWYSRLFEDPQFVVRVKERFNYFYSNKNIIFNEINENATYLKYSVLENNAVWGTLYKYTWPNYAIWGSYENEVTYLKQWLNARMEWLKTEFDAM